MRKSGLIFIVKVFLLLVSFGGICIQQTKATIWDGDIILTDHPPKKSEETKTELQPVNTFNPKALFFKKPIALDRNELLAFAQTLIGTPYLYGSIQPNRGLDCSGFVYHVFRHFDISCPRTSKEYFNEGKTISLAECQAGDLLLFTSPSSHKSRTVGHIGIVIETQPEIKFIHSSSGKAKSVTISKLNGSYAKRLIKAVQVLE